MPYKISYKTTNFLYRDTEIEAIQSRHSFIFPEALTPFLPFTMRQSAIGQSFIQIKGAHFVDGTGVSLSVIQISQVQCCACW